MNKEEKDAIIKLIKDYVEEHGSCRVGWAAKEILKLQKEIPNPDKEKIANTIIETSEYIKELSAKNYIDWNIRKNPVYTKERIEIDLAKSNIETNKLNEKNTKRNLWFSIINIIVGALNISILIWQTIKNG